MSAITPTVLIIVGSTGDVSRRLLLPALSRLYTHGALQMPLELIGTTRKDGICAESLIDDERIASILTIRKFSTHEDAEDLRTYIQTLEEKYNQAYHVVAYLAVPPSAILDSAHLLASTAIVDRIVLEKPFGHDMVSAKELSTELSYCFTDSQIIRVDHYLTKKVLQDALNYIDILDGTLSQIVITIDEAIDIQGRAGFYEETGALRDMVQSHALLVAATLYARAYGISREEALKFLAPAEVVLRAQYEGYADEVGNPTTTTETFVHIETLIGQTKLVITSGKALDRKETAITIISSSLQGEQQKTFIEHRPEPWEPTGYEKILLQILDPAFKVSISDTELSLLWGWIDAVREVWQKGTFPLSRYPKGTSATKILTKM